jgi:plasmid stabilization system protein ParE
MRVRWTTDAADDLERICDHIAQSRPESARRVAQTVVERIGTLENFPHLGRSGRVPDTREIAFPPLHSSRSTRSLTTGTKCGCSGSYMAHKNGHHVKSLAGSFKLCAPEASIVIPIDTLYVAGIDIQ